MWAILIPIFVVVGLLLIVFVVMYNGLVGRKNLVEQAFATIDVQLKKRADLIPNLVSTVQAYMKHESGTLTKITELRARAQAAGPQSGERMSLENQIGGLLKGLMVQVEDYPELKASENFSQLQRSLNEVEAQLAAARRTYNASVTEFNNAVEMFPTNLVAGVMSYRRRELFEIDEADRKSPDVGKMFEK
jgi:LemA protein